MHFKGREASYGSSLPKPIKKKMLNKKEGISKSKKAKPDGTELDKG